MAQTGVHMRNEGMPMPPLYARTMLLDAQAGQPPVLSDVELLAASYLSALEALASVRWGEDSAEAEVARAFGDSMNKHLLPHPLCGQTVPLIRRRELATVGELADKAPYMRCHAITRRGWRCSRTATADTDYCRQHRPEVILR